MHRERDGISPAGNRFSTNSSPFFPFASETFSTRVESSQRDLARLGTFSFCLYELENRYAPWNRHTHRKNRRFGDEPALYNGEIETRLIIRWEVRPVPFSIFPSWAWNLPRRMFTIWRHELFEFSFEIEIVSDFLAVSAHLQRKFAYLNWLASLKYTLKDPSCTESKGTYWFRAWRNDRGVIIDRARKHENSV